jgi:exopolysaccharide production protein ExoY
MSQTRQDTDVDHRVFVDGVRRDQLFSVRLRSSAALRLQLAVKRLIDVLGSLVLIVLLAPLMLGAALLVRATSPGPAFYTAKRWGYEGRQFACIKLRSMYVDQDTILARHGLNNLGDQGRLLVFNQDPRITPVGAVLRKLSLDELPQLLNVLRGDMSLIGPRPLALSMLESYPDIRAARGAMRPGITGLWQVRNRTKNASVFDMVEDDMAYIDGFSLWLDCRIAVLTLPRIIEPPKRRGIQAG